MSVHVQFGPVRNSLETCRDDDDVDPISLDVLRPPVFEKDGRCFNLDTLAEWLSTIPDAEARIPKFYNRNPNTNLPFRSAERLEIFQTAGVNDPAHGNNRLYDIRDDASDIANPEGDLDAELLFENPELLLHDIENGFGDEDHLIVALEYCTDDPTNQMWMRVANAIFARADFDAADIFDTLSLDIVNDDYAVQTMLFIIEHGPNINPNLELPVPYRFNHPDEDDEDEAADEEAEEYLHQPGLLSLAWQHDEFAPVIEALLHRGADGNVRSRLQQTPLMCAVIRGHAENVRVLLAGGVDQTLVDSKGHNALHYAQQGSNNTIIRLLGGRRRNVRRREFH